MGSMRMFLNLMSLSDTGLEVMGQKETTSVGLLLRII